MHQAVEFHPHIKSILKMADLHHLEFRIQWVNSLKTPCRTSYRLSIETVALAKPLSSFGKLRFMYVFWRVAVRQTDGQTDGQQMDRPSALSRARYRLTHTLQRVDDNLGEATVFG